MLSTVSLPLHIAQHWTNADMSAPKDSRSGSNKADATSTLSPDAARSGRSSYDTHRVSTSERSRSRDMRYKVDAEARHRGIKDKFMDKLVPEFLK